MPNDPNELLTKTITTNKYQITYFADRDEFRLEFSDPVRIENVSIERFVINLDGDIVRQMAEVLPPRDPESVH
jgi:hypothetical protein